MVICLEQGADLHMAPDVCFIAAVLLVCKQSPNASTLTCENFTKTRQLKAVKEHAQL